jgi:ribonuclease PH
MLYPVYKKETLCVIIQAGVQGDIEQNRAAPKQNLTRARYTMQTPATNKQQHARQKHEHQRQRKLPRNEPIK